PRLVHRRRHELVDQTESLDALGEGLLGDEPGAGRIACEHCVVQFVQIVHGSALTAMMRRERVLNCPDFAFPLAEIGGGLWSKKGLGNAKPSPCVGGSGP